MKRILAVDGLRGYAVLMVLIFHLLNNSYIATSLSDLNHFELFLLSVTNYGWVGVNLFFVISGYLLGTILLINRDAVNFFVVFYVRRFSRILPIYFIFLFSYLLGYAVFYHEGLSMFEKPIAIEYYFLFLQNFMMSRFGHFGPNSLTPTWSLAVEEQFYLIIPLIIYFFSNRKVYLISIAFVIGSFFYRLYSDNWYEEYTHFFSRVDSLFLGVLLAIYRSPNCQVKAFFGSWWFKMAVIILLFFLYFLFKCTNHLLISFIFLVILDWVITVKEDSLFFKLLANRFILLLGKYSFFIYLFHQFFNGLCFVIFSNGTNPNLTSFSSYCIEIFSLCVTISLAHLSYEYIESKFMRYSHRFKYRIN